MKKLFLFLLVLGQISLKAQNVDLEKSKVNFEISNLGFNTVEGSFSGLDGKLYLNMDAVHKSILKVCLEVNSIETGIAKRDEHLKSEDFFWLDKHPQICFNGDKFKYLGDHHWQVSGYLNIRGISKYITVALTYKDDILECEFMLNRFDYELGSDISTFTAGKEVEIKVHLEKKAA
ncbi:YceI family protein [Croceimicrobium hydrocarbonivorans]|uniref:YceI family protein n=1 Tax=Croceimicrobium hydrocarbonivorans TaxID=2761580 RepID=A0A7H0VIA0_9FLAO|nr:YceI family protein [Croceimicrobium hydrocarbonivorans]QNR25448.1 YceI family protein [Croceimicrobium hydrocarbonivorans]